MTQEMKVDEGIIYILSKDGSEAWDQLEELFGKGGRFRRHRYDNIDGDIGIDEAFYVLMVVYVHQMFNMRVINDGTT